MVTGFLRTHRPPNSLGQYHLGRISAPARHPPVDRVDLGGTRDSSRVQCTSPESAAPAFISRAVGFTCSTHGRSRVPQRPLTIACMYAVCVCGVWGGDARGPARHTFHVHGWVRRRSAARPLLSNERVIASTPSRSDARLVRWSGAWPPRCAGRAGLANTLGRNRGASSHRLYVHLLTHSA